MLFYGKDYIKLWLWNLKNRWIPENGKEDGFGTVEVILILVGILTPYYRVSIRCIEWKYVDK